jgi:hypothetical protein
MSNGVIAIRGFEYQATVILDRLFDHFDRNGPTARVRPEGDDDLDLYWTENQVEHRHYLQIKKPREDDEGNLRPRPWTLSDAVTELLPNTIRQLRGNRHEQTWIIGDVAADDLQALLDAGINGPIDAAKPYWTAVHLLVRNEIVDAAGLDKAKREKFLRWRPTIDPQIKPSDAFKAVIEAFRKEIKDIGGSEALADRYSDKVTELHQDLPDILARTSLIATYGTEGVVAERIKNRLQQQYGLQRTVIDNALFRNLRGFIVDISKQSGRFFDHAEFELELRTIWPNMVPISDVPSLDGNHIPRSDLSERFTTRWSGKAIEAVGISGSGKTMLAAEVAARSRSTDSNRLVFYAEVRPDTSLRDVLVGLSYHLRRWGLDLFAESVEIGPSYDDVLAKLAKRYSALAQPILLLVDLVDGSSSDAFARDLATLVRSLLPSSSLRIAVFGQESAFRALSDFEREQHGIGRVDVRGFRFEEFVSLVGQYHPAPDRAALSDIYTRTTAGREAGLFARLAQSIAGAPSVPEMALIAAKPAEEMVFEAERRRFARVGQAARSAAEKLVCFALPFRRKDAEEVFPDDNIGAALKELSTLGLVRPHDIDAFEMHEVVRAGLESHIAVNTRRSAHRALATWYSDRGLVTAEILHLEKAGDQAQAEKRAREVFLLGKHWAALSSYVIEHKLVSGDEIIARIATSDPVEDCYILPTLLRNLGAGGTADQLVDILRSQPDRFASDHQWGLAIVEVILERDATRLQELITFVVQNIADQNRREAGLSWLMLAVRRKGVQVDPSVIAMFNAASPEIKQQILPFLLRARQRAALQPALQFLTSAEYLVVERGRSRPWNDPSLEIGDRQDAVEFLAALPDANYAGMVAAKSPLLGTLSAIVWPRRTELRTYSLQILRDVAAEEKVLESAIRVLVFLGERSVWECSEPFLKRQDRVGRLAALVPAMLPGVCDRALYEAKVLDKKLNLNDRAAALLVLAFAGSDLGLLFKRVLMNNDDAADRNQLGGIFLLACVQAPFVGAVPLVEAQMRSAAPEIVPVITAVLDKLAELPDPEVTGLLIKALSNPIQEIRHHAAVSISQRRSRVALPSLSAQLAAEKEPGLIAALASAIVASGPSSVSALEAPQPDVPSASLWRCILAMRLRDTTAADEVVALATDRSQNWQLRRAAIFAAGRMPYEAALEKIVPVIMQEEFALELDKNPNLQCHETASFLLQFDLQALLRIYLRGRAEFAKFFGETFDALWQQVMSREGLPAGDELAGWIFDRLQHYGWPNKGDAPDRLLNELHVPMLQGAILRSLRIAGRPEQIEALLPGARHVWLAIRGVLERRRAGYDPQLRLKLKGLLATSPVGDAPILERILNEIPAGDLPPLPSAPVPDVASGATRSPAITRLSNDEAVRILSDPSAVFNPAGPVVLEALDNDEFERLVKLADPANDHYPSVEKFLPGVSFTPHGPVVARRTITSSGGETTSAKIRPAVAAANRFRSDIPWHEDLLNSVQAATYIPRLLASLDAQNDSVRFYEELEAHAEVLLSHLSKAAVPVSVAKYVDGRIVPFLLRHMSSGTSEHFENFCTIALLVETPEIDPVLSGLLYRFVQQFDFQSPFVQHTENYALWRGFKQLAKHPRFERIPGWQSRLAPLLQVQLGWVHSEQIVRELERSPRSYSLIEARLFRATSWVHYNQDEIDRLDAAAEHLFPSLLEN